MNPLKRCFSSSDVPFQMVTRHEKKRRFEVCNNTLPSIPILMAVSKTLSNRDVVQLLSSLSRVSKAMNKNCRLVGNYMIDQRAIPLSYLPKIKHSGQAIDYALKEGLTTLSLREFEHDVYWVSKELAKSLLHIKKLFLQAVDVDNELLNNLPQNLNVLSIDSLDARIQGVYNDSLLESLPESIRELDLREFYVTDGIIPHLPRGLKKLKFYYEGFECLKGDGFHHLPPALEELEIPCFISYDGFGNLIETLGVFDQLPESLKVLSVIQRDMINTSHVPSYQTRFRGFPKGLTKIKLVEKRKYSSVPNLIDGLPVELEALECQGYLFTREEVRSLPRGIKHLTFFQCSSINQKGWFNQFSEYERLETLDLTGSSGIVNPLQVIDIKDWDSQIKKLPKSLKELNLTHVQPPVPTQIIRRLRKKGIEVIVG